jgi:ubiquinone/menaquinone biosynthesis C-methylase UbiE
MHPEADVVGIDPDPTALSVSERKAKRARLTIKFDRGFSDHLPYVNATFDRVFSSFMFHHLAADEKAATLAEIRRVLKAGGSLHLLDFTRAHDAHPGTGEHWPLVHRRRLVAERIESRMTSLMDEAGLADAKEVARRRIFFGPIAYYCARNA